MTERRALLEWDGYRELTCSLNLRWVLKGRVALDDSGRLLFPQVDPAAGLYRFVARDPGGRLATYVGESEDLRRRFGNYRNPGPTQQTSQRIHHWLKELLGVGGQVSVSIADMVRLDANVVDLSRKAARRMFEQMAVVLEHAEEVESLNR